MTIGKQGKKNRRNKKKKIPTLSSNILNPPSLESVENGEELTDDKIEEKNPIDELNLTVKTLKESLDELRNEQKIMENQQKLILEELQSIRENTEEKEKSDENEKPSFNSVISPGSLMKNTLSNGMPPVGKSFVLKHVFRNVSEFEENKWNCGEEEEHFGVPWSMFVYKNNQHLNFYFLCNKALDTGKWAIDRSYTLKLMGNNGKTTTAEIQGVFGNIDEDQKRFEWGRQKFISWEELKKDYFIDDKLTAEVHVEINKMTGVYKENLRNFDESMKELSDMVLIVGEQKFYVNKMYLATHSPYFKTLFLGQFQESNKSEIKLSGIASEDFQNYLEVLYGDPSIDETTVEGILLVADMYDTAIVVGKCANFLMNESKKSNKKKLQMAIRYNLDKLKRKCISEIKTVADIKSMISGYIKDLDPSIMAELLEKSISLQ